MLHRRIDPLQLRSLLLDIVTIISLIVIIIVAVSGSPRSFAVEQPSDVPAWLRPISAKAKVKSHKWFYRGRARFTWKK
jgi:hypothetical protein